MRSQIIIKGDDVATTNNILAHEFLYRTGILSIIISNLIYLLLVLALYRLFKQVNADVGKLMVALVVIQITASFIIELFSITSLMVLKGDIMPALDPKQRQDTAMLFLKMHSNGLDMLELFWGLWLIPFGWLAYRSEFIPRIIGILLIAGGVVYTADWAISLLFPTFNSPFWRYLLLVPSIAELVVMLWLLIVGVKAKKAV